MSGRQWKPGEYTRRKGGCPLVYLVAETSDAGALLKTMKGGKPRGLGRWHSWKAMVWDFLPSTPEPPLNSYKFGRAAKCQAG